MLSDAQVKTMIRLRQEQNLSLAALGERYGITAERARQILKQRGVATTRIPAPPKVHSSSRRSYDWDLIEKMHRVDGKSSYDIGLELDANPTYIRQGLANRGRLRERQVAAELKRRQQELALVS